MKKQKQSVVLTTEEGSAKDLDHLAEVWEKRLTEVAPHYKIQAMNIKEKGDLFFLSENEEIREQILTQEEVDRLSLFIEAHIEEEENPHTAEVVKNIFNKLPDSEEMIMKIIKRKGEGNNE